MPGVDVFTRLDVYHRYLGGTVLFWDLNYQFVRAAPQPLTFVVKASRSGAGDWMEIATIEDNYHYLVDPNRWVWAKDLRIHYVVEVTDKKGNEYRSQVKQALGTLPYPDRLVAREIMRKEEMLLQKKVGNEGLLYKRRHWGELCTDSCVDYDTNEPTANRCETCYDTGFVGGYHDPISVWMHLKAASGRRMSLETPTQTTENRSKHGRTIVCPWLDTNDIWVNCANDQHFAIQKVTPVEYRGVPIIFDPIDLRLAQSSDIVYTLPRAGSGSSDESDSA